MTDRLATDILVHEWNGANECIHGCLCVCTMQTWNQLCPNRVHELQQRYAKLKIERDEMWLTLLNEQGAGEPPCKEGFSTVGPWPSTEVIWKREGVGTVRRIHNGEWEWRINVLTVHQHNFCHVGGARTARQAIRDLEAQPYNG